MNFVRGSNKNHSKGFLYVASVYVWYYETAVYSANTLKDFYPDAHITLFTHEKFVDKKADVFDNVITNIPVHHRTKMWGCARTPYDRTVYIDADSFIMHRDIKTIHEHLDDCDMFFTPVTPYTVSNIKYAYMDRALTQVPNYHGAVYGYHNSPLILDFMQTWYDDYIIQKSTPGWKYAKDHVPEWKPFDMFTLWRLTNKKEPEYSRFHNLNIKKLPLRYNTTAAHAPEDKKRPVIHQIDKSTLKRIDHLWGPIEEKMNNEIYQFKQYSHNQIPSEYN